MANLSDEKQQELVDELTKEFEIDFNAAEDESDAANEDIRMISQTGAMWDDEVREAFADRPRFEFDIVSTPVRKYAGEFVTAPVGVSFSPANRSTPQSDADFVTKMFRADWRRSNGNAKLESAVFEQGACGIGAMRLGTGYVDENDDDNDTQQINVDFIPAAHASVFWDANSQQMLKGDANRCTILWEYTEDSFKANWPDADAASFEDKQDGRFFNWVAKDLIYVGEVYKKRTKKTMLHTYENPSTAEIVKVKESDFNAEEMEQKLKDLKATGFKKKSTKRVKDVFVEKVLMNGHQILEGPQRVAGGRIPIIPFYGWWWYVDGQERYFGMIRKLKDAQRLLNMSVSNTAEAAAGAVRDTPVVYDDEVLPFLDLWNNADKTKVNVLPLKRSLDKNGVQRPGGIIGTRAAARVDPNNQAVAAFTQDYVQQQTGGIPQDIVSSDASGVARLAANKQVDLLSITLKNHVSMGMEVLGDIYADMAGDVYSQGQEVMLVSEDGSDSIDQVLKQIFDDKTGQMVSTNDPSGGKFNVVASAGVSYQTQREEVSANLIEMFNSTEPGTGRDLLYMSWVENQDGPGLESIKKENRKQMIIKGFKDPETEEEKAMVQQLIEQQQQTDPMQGLIDSEAAKNAQDIEESQAKTVNLLADSELKAAKTQTERAKAVSEVMGRLQ